jgi:hypothetical protein
LLSASSYSDDISFSKVLPNLMGLCEDNTKSPARDIFGNSVVM